MELTSLRVFAHYDITLLIKVAADASAYGVGAVMSNVFFLMEKSVPLLSPRGRFRQVSVTTHKWRKKLLLLFLVFGNFTPISTDADLPL